MVAISTPFMIIPCPLLLFSGTVRFRTRWPKRGVLPSHRGSTQGCLRGGRLTQEVGPGSEFLWANGWLVWIVHYFSRKKLEKSWKKRVWTIEWWIPRNYSSDELLKRTFWNVYLWRIQSIAKYVCFYLSVGQSNLMTHRLDLAHQKKRCAKKRPRGYRCIGNSCWHIRNQQGLSWYFMVSNKHVFPMQGGAP